MNPNNFKMAQSKNYADSVKERAKKNEAYMRKLYQVSGVSVFFIIAQLIGGYISGSIAIFADTAHLASDMMGFVIAMAGIKLGEKRANSHMSFGYHRAELVGTLVSVISIWIMTIWLLVAATERFFMPPQVVGSLMFIVAVVGLFFNMIQIKILHGGDEHFHLGEDMHGDDHGHSHGGDKEEHKSGHEGEDHGHDHGHGHGDGGGNMNMDAATLHVLGDLLSSVGVIIASIFIYFWPSMWYMDPICTYIFAIFVSYTTLPTVKKLLDLMMEATPEVIAVEKDGDKTNKKKPKDKQLTLENLHADILDSCDAICEYHDLHVWKLGGGKMSMTCHITSHMPSQTLQRVTDMVRDKYKLFHTSIQVEVPMGQKFHFKCEQDVHDDDREYKDEKHKKHGEHSHGHGHSHGEAAKKDE